MTKPDLIEYLLAHTDLAERRQNRPAVFYFRKESLPPEVQTTLPAERVILHEAPGVNEWQVTF